MIGSSSYDLQRAQLQNVSSRRRVSKERLMVHMRVGKCGCGQSGKDRQVSKRASEGD